MNTDSINEISLGAGVRIALIGVLAILSLFLFAKTWATVEEVGRIDVSTIATISVTGTGKASALPNIAQISFSIQESGATGEEAQSKATKRTNEALTALKKLTIADKDIKTTGYQVTPEYEVKACPPRTFCPQTAGKIIGYQVSQSVEAKVRDTDKTGAVLQALTTLGVQNISGPNFTIEDESVVLAQARGKAIADAREKAEILARQLGVRLGKVVGFSENGGGIYPSYDRALGKTAVMNEATPAPTLLIGENETNISVTVIYEIR